MLAAIVLFQPSCKPRETVVERGIREQILHVGNGVEPSDLDPHTNTGSPESVILDTLFEPLIRRNKDITGFDPAAADHWSVSEDGKTLTFHVREGMRWSNGDPVTAVDYRDSFHRALEPSLGSQPATYMYPIAGAEAYHKGTLKDFSKVGISTTDSHTLVIQLTKPVPYFIQLMTGYPFVAVHLASVETFGGLKTPGTSWTLPGNLISDGPFTLERWQPNQDLVVKRNPLYWNADNVRLQEIHFHPIESQDTEERAYRGGQLHVTNALSVSKIEPYKRDNPEALRITPRLGVSYLFFNVRAAPFDDARVRRAFALALDRRQIVESVLRGGQRPAYSLSQPGMGGYAPVSMIEENFDEARRLLSEAGFPQGKRLPQVTYLYNTSDLNRDVAQALQEMWRKNLGVDVRIVNQEWKVFLDSRNLGNFQIARAGWNPFADEPTDYFQQVLTNGTYNDSGWSNPEFDRLFEEASTTMDPESRHALYRQMDTILLTEIPVVPLFYSSIVRLVHPSVQNWHTNLLDTRPLHLLWLRGETE